MTRDENGSLAVKAIKPWIEVISIIAAAAFAAASIITTTALLRQEIGHLAITIDKMALLVERHEDRLDAVEREMIRLESIAQEKRDQRSRQK